MIGQVIGSYRIAAELGQGGMGVVYRAEHVQLGRPVAIKMLLPQMSSDPTIVQRFFNEARAASAIDHPGIVEVYDFGTHTDGSAYLVMELLKGESLDHRLLRHGMPPLEAASILAQVAGALAAAHARGIVHRDLKPDNIFLVPNELLPGGIQVKLLDFGIAKLADERAAGFKTQTGVLIGTPAYMSPEQCMGRPDIDHRSDLYSLGCILFHMLCGRPPFYSDQGTGVMIAMHLRDPAPDPRTLAPHLPAPLVAITLRLLEKEPAARFQSAQELRAALVAAGAVAPSTRPDDAHGATLASTPSSQHHGRDAYAATAALTTGSGSAAELLTKPDGPAARGWPARPPKRSGRGVWLAVGGMLVAVAGVGVAVAVSSGGGGGGSGGSGSGDSGATVAGGGGEPISSGKPVVQQPDPQRPDPQRPQPDPPEQPKKPDPQQIAEPNPALRPPPPDGRVTEPALQLGAASYPPGAAIDIRFSAPISSTSGHRAWIAVSPAGSPPTSYGTWSYVDDGARGATLKAPAKSGAYELRLYTDYPAKSYNVARTASFTVAPLAEAPDSPPSPPGATPLADQRFTLASTTIPRGGRAELRFPVPLRALPREQFWVTVVERRAADSTWGKYAYVPADARTMSLDVPSTPGDYEVRLHANYPTKTTNLVYRAVIRVE